MTDTDPTTHSGWEPVRAWVADAITRGVVLVVPLVLVNGFAVYGQTKWALDNISPSLEVAALFAAALESIGLFLAAEAHSALMAGDAALRLRLGSYAVAALIGGLNYSHWAADWAPNPKAVTFAALSAISPWLWAIRSRSMHRAELRAKGLVDPRTVRFAMARWILYPVATFRQFRRAVWVGETDPARAAGLAAATPEASPVPVPAPRREEPLPEQPSPVEPDPAPEPTPRPARPARKAPGKAGARGKAEQIRRAKRDQPAATNVDLASRFQVSPKTVQRALNGGSHLAAVGDDAEEEATG